MGIGVTDGERQEETVPTNILDGGDGIANITQTIEGCPLHLGEEDR